MKKRFWVALGVVTTGGGLTVAVGAWAASCPAIEFTQAVPLPGFASFTSVDCSSIGNYIIEIYKFGVYGASFLAAIMLMAAGFVWLTAGGNASQVGKARSLMAGALSGFILILLSWVILNTINPNLTRFKSLDIESIAQAPLGPLDTAEVQLGMAGPCNSSGSGIDPATRSACVADNYSCNYAYNCSSYPSSSILNLNLGDAILDPAVGCCMPLGGEGAPCATRFDCLSGACVNGSGDFSRKFGFCERPLLGPEPAH